MSATPRSRAEVIYQGTVQGVGFRYTARRLAQNRALDGYVKNLPDGTVLLVAEGARSEILAFLDDVADTMRGYIREADVRWSPPVGEPAGFQIRF